MSHWSVGDVITNGLRIHYHRTGGDKPQIVLAHGVTDSGLCWPRVARALESEYDLVMYDARGHGGSEAPQRPYSTEDLADDMADLIQALGLEKPVLIGHSMGARTSAVAAANYPKLVRAAVLEDPPWRSAAIQPSAGSQRITARLEGYKARTREELIAFGKERSPDWADEVFPPWADAKLQCSLEARRLSMPLRTDWRETLRQITCPVLLLVADPEIHRDIGLGGVVTPEVAREASSIMQDGRVVRIDGAGHNIRRERFETYLAAVSEFLEYVH